MEEKVSMERKTDVGYQLAQAPSALVIDILTIIFSRFFMTGETMLFQTDYTT
jgi:hypothetical protein